MIPIEILYETYDRYQKVGVIYHEERRGNIIRVIRLAEVIVDVVRSGSPSPDLMLDTVTYHIERFNNAYCIVTKVLEDAHQLMKY